MHDVYPKATNTQRASALESNNSESLPKNYRSQRYEGSYMGGKCPCVCVLDCVRGCQLGKWMAMAASQGSNSPPCSGCINKLRLGKNNSISKQNVNIKRNPHTITPHSQIYVKKLQFKICKKSLKGSSERFQRIGSHFLKCIKTELICQLISKT